MLFQSSRFEARVDREGNLVKLEDQDRSKWDSEKIALGSEYLAKAAQTEVLNEYLIQASISAQHCQAASYEETNWKAILNLYDLHVQLNNDPILELNRVVPLQKVHGSLLAQKEIERLEATHFFEEYYLFYAIKAYILEDLGDITECRNSLKKAIDLVKNTREKDFLIQKFTRLA